MSEHLFDLTTLRINPENPFPFEGTKEEWENFRANVERDPEFMEANKIAYDSTNENLIIAGNKRTKALLEIGQSLVPQEWVIDCSKWDEEKRERYIYASNKSIGQWSIEFADTELMEEFDIEFGENEEIDYSSKNKEIDVDDFEDKMTITLEYTMEEYHQVKSSLNKVAQTPEAAIWELLGLGEYEPA